MRHEHSDQLHGPGAWIFKSPTSIPPIWVNDLTWSTASLHNISYPCGLPNMCMLYKRTKFVQDCNHGYFQERQIWGANSQSKFDITSGYDELVSTDTLPCLEVRVVCVGAVIVDWTKPNNEYRKHIQVIQDVGNSGQPYPALWTRKLE